MMRELSAGLECAAHPFRVSCNCNLAVRADGLAKRNKAGHQHSSEDSGEFRHSYFDALSRRLASTVRSLYHATRNGFCDGIDINALLIRFCQWPRSVSEASRPRALTR